MIDEIIAAIRASEDKAAARDALMAEPFEFSEVQAAAHPRHAAVAGSPGWAGPSSRRRWPSCARPSPSSRRSSATTASCAASSRTSWREIRTKFADPRRSEITYDPGDIDIEDLIDDEDLVVTMSRRAT